MSDALPIQIVKPAGTSAAQAMAMQGVTGGVPVTVTVTGSTTFFGITESSTGNGTSPTLTLGHTPTDEPRVFVAGLRQILGTHYTRVGAVLTWVTIPVSGDTIQVDYTWSMASASLASTLVVDVNGNIQPTGDTSDRSIHTTVDNAALPLPTGAATAARQDAQSATLLTLQRIGYAQLVQQQVAAGQLFFQPEVPFFAAGA